MFDKDSLNAMFDELRDEYELEPEWEEIQRDAHLAVAWADAGVLDENQDKVDTRILSFVDKHNPD